MECFASRMEGSTKAAMKVSTKVAMKTAEAMN